MTDMLHGWPMTRRDERPLLSLDQGTMDRAEKTALLDGWRGLADRDPIAAIEDRLARSALSSVAIDDPANQDAILALLRRRAFGADRFAAFQAVLFDTTRHEDLHRHQIVTLLTPCQSKTE